VLYLTFTGRTRIPDRWSWEHQTDASVITFNAVEVASKIQQGVGGTIRTLKLGDSGELKKVKSKKG